MLVNLATPPYSGADAADTYAKEPVARVARGSREPGGRLGRDLAMTMLTQVAIGLGGLFIYRLIALSKNAEGVAAYALVKQVAVFVWPVTMIGLHTAIPRSVALVRDRSGAAETYLLAAVMLTGAATGAVCAIALVSPELTASLVFGDRDLHELVVPFAATLAATVLINVTYGYFRGRSEFMVGNSCGWAPRGVPVGVLLVASGASVSSARWITLMAILTIVPCIAVLAAPLIERCADFPPRRSATPAPHCSITATGASPATSPLRLCSPCRRYWRRISQISQVSPT